MEEKDLNAEHYAGWQKLHQNFVKSGMTVEDYCRTKGLQLNWFIRQQRKAETYEKRLAPPTNATAPVASRLEKLFVELVADADEPISTASELIVTCLHVELCLTMVGGKLVRVRP